MAEFERSAMTGRQFSEWAGIRYSTFGNWWRARKKLRRAELPARATEKATGTRWLEAVVEKPSPKARGKLKSGPLIVHGRGGVRLELNDDGQIKLAAQLLRELGWEQEC